jgi:class 3 adenylate cyclase
VTAVVTATFVFTDLVDSTATAARLGPDGAEQLRQTHFKLLRNAVVASGGTEVKNLGDGLMVMYSSPSRALAGAVGMQQAIDGHNRSAVEPLRVRIGVSAGEATEEDGDYFGGPVVEAARLCAAADGGHILAADVVRALVGRHATQTFRDVGELELKGLPDPLPAVEVEWEPLTLAGSAPLPPRLATTATDALFGFFGRATELAAFDDARKRAQTARRCQVVLVSGEAGLGKTSLVAQAARAAHGQGNVVLFGHSTEDAGIAYQPWIEIVSALVSLADDETVARLRPAPRAALSRLAPDIDAGTEQVADPDTQRLLMWEGTVALLAAASEPQPLFLVLDDLHWADTSTLQLLRHLIASASEMNVTVACTYRDTDLGRGDPLNHLLSDLHRESNVSRVALRGLDDHDLVELMAAAAGHELDDAGVGLAQALRRETNGNPFFTGEILRHLVESRGIVLGEDGRWTVAGNLEQVGLPNSVRDVVGRRVERLGDETNRVLSVAAVIGREFDLDLLAELVDVDEDPLLDLLDAAVAASLIVDAGVAGRYRFAHALVQHSLYEELSTTRRQRAHKRIAEQLEAQAAGRDAATLAELAHHWLAATRPADVDKALDYVRRAGDAARDALAPDDAARWYARALELLGDRPMTDPRPRVELLVALGQAEYLAGRPEWRTTLLDAFHAAERANDDTLVVNAALGFARFLGEYYGDAEVQLILTNALARLPPEPTPTRARLLAARSESFDAAAEAVEKRTDALDALEAARAGGDDLAFIDVIRATFTVLETPDRREQTIADLETATAIADRSADPALRAKSRLRSIWADFQRADPDGVDGVLDELQALTDVIGLPVVRYEYEILRAGRLLLAGDAEAAEQSTNTVLAIGGAAEIPGYLAAYGGLLYAICEHRGTVDTIADFFMQAAVEHPSIAALRSAVTTMLADFGRLDEAAARLDQDLSFDYPYDTLWSASMANLLDAAATTRHTDAARELVGRVGMFADHVINPNGSAVNGVLARPLARAATALGEFDQAERWFDLAHDLHARLRAPFWIARAQLDHADLCLARRADGDRERARELITTAAATAAEFGCGGLTRRADALLAEL